MKIQKESVLDLGGKCKMLCQNGRLNTTFVKEHFCFYQCIFRKDEELKSVRIVKN